MDNLISLTGNGGRSSSARPGLKQLIGQPLRADLTCSARGHGERLPSRDAALGRSRRRDRRLVNGRDRPPRGPAFAGEMCQTDDSRFAPGPQIALFPRGLCRPMSFRAG